MEELEKLVTAKTTTGGPSTISMGMSTGRGDVCTVLGVYCVTTWDHKCVCFCVNWRRVCVFEEDWVNKIVTATY